MRCPRIRSWFVLQPLFLVVGLTLCCSLTGCDRAEQSAPTPPILRVTEQAVTLPAGFIEEPVGGAWQQVVGMTFAPDGRLLVWEKSGKIWLVQDEIRAATPILDISEEIGNWRDFGLLGVALHPNFSNNGFIYLLYVVDYHHLTTFGTAEYQPATDQYFRDTIGRVTRYTANRHDDFATIDLQSRTVLLGETIDSGVPILHQSHGTGSILFGNDGSLLISTGDGASYSVTDIGGPISGSSNTGLSDGIITPKEDVGAFRSQLVDSLSGKILRLDPSTGSGLPSNPFFDPAAPRSARSRVWSLGLRNPYRMTLRPNTGSHNPADGDPGVLYIGDVGWNTWEELDIASAAGQNFGWPLFEGLTAHAGYTGANIQNLDAANPLFGTADCSRTHFYFRELLIQDTANTASFPNPCDAASQVPSQIPHFVHARPALDWRHGADQARVPGFDTSGNATTVRISAAGSPVSGTEFRGNCSVAGVWYTGTEFPEQYQNTYFHADYGGRWIRNLVFDEENRLSAVRHFVPNDSANLVALAAHPTDGSLYYVDYSSTLRRIRYVGGGNRPPRLVATASPHFGPSPLTVQFTGSESSDPEMGPLSYSWDFGDGSPLSSEENPTHTFVSAGTGPARFTVTLTATDVAGASASTALVVSPGNTPPTVTITSPTSGGTFSQSGATAVVLEAQLGDAEHTTNDLSCEWTTILHHNEHTHPEATDTDCSTVSTVTPVGCYDETYYYSFQLKVTDSEGLSTTETAILYPDCAPRLLTPAGPGHSTLPTYRWTPVLGANGYVLAVSNAQGTEPVELVFSAADAGCADGFNDCAVTPATPVFPGDASFRVRANNPVDGLREWSEALTFGVANALPTVTISAPTGDLRWTAGQAIEFAGSAVDPEDGALPASRLLWTTSTGQSFAGVAAGSLVAPGDPLPQMLGISLVATDSVGSTANAELVLQPDVANVTFNSVPAGLSLTVNGQSQTTPFQATFVTGASLMIAAADQSSAGGNYTFQSWSDGGAASHAIVVGATAYTAQFSTPNRSPIASAGVDQIVASGTVVTLDGTMSSDPDGDPLTYVWSQVSGPAVALSNTAASLPSFIAPNVSTATAIGFSLRVSDGAVFSEPDGVTILIQPAVGTGLFGEYFDNSNFTGTRVTRIDRTIDFNWGSGRPISGIGPSTFSVRWTGELEPRFTETYRFTALSDDGVRLWINGQQVLNSWTNRAFWATEASGTIALTAGQRVPIRLEYYEYIWNARIRLSWSSARQANQVVPVERLFPSAP